MSQAEGADGTARASSVPSPDGPTFGNLRGDTPEAAGRSELVLEEDGRWYEIMWNKDTPSGVPPAKGHYAFVIQNDRIWAVPERSDFGHLEAAQGERVTWAGTIEFTASGDLVEWTNLSGHVLPSGYFAKNVRHPGLPIEKFDWARKGTVVVPGVKRIGPQLPVIQPTKNQTLIAQDKGGEVTLTGASEPGPTPPSGGGTVNPSPDGGHPPAAAAASAERSVKPPSIDLSRYPPDGEGRITRFFKDRPVLRQLGAVAATAAAQIASSEAMEAVQSHFASALDQAYDEFVSKFPDPNALLRSAGIDQRRQAYDAALAKLRAPENARIFAQIWTAALTPSEDVEAGLRYADERLADVRLGSDDMKTFLDAGSAYEQAMCDLQEQLVQHLRPLPAIADDIGRRAAGLQSTGRELQQTFWSLTQSPAAAIPFVGNQMWPIYSAGRTIENLGNRMGALADEINSRAGEYQRTHDELNERLADVGAQLNAFPTATTWKRR